MSTSPRLTPRPTVYNGITMRSRLEAGFAAWLDERHFTWEYEPCAFATDTGQYLPDFRLHSVSCSWLACPATVYAEIKPESWVHNKEDFDRMRIIQESEPEAVLILVQERAEERIGESMLPFVYKVHALPEFSSHLLVWAAATMDGDTRLVGLASPLFENAAPWPNGYWKG